MELAKYLEVADDFDNPDVYEFTGFGDDPAGANKSRGKGGSPGQAPSGRPTSSRMFSIGPPARKRKLDESPSKSQVGKKIFSML